MHSSLFYHSVDNLTNWFCLVLSWFIRNSQKSQNSKTTPSSIDKIIHHSMLSLMKCRSLEPTINKKKQQKVDTLLQNCIHSLSNNFDNSDNRSRNIKHIDIGYQSFLCIYLYTRAACYVHHLLALLVLFFLSPFKPLTVPRLLYHCDLFIL